MRSFGRRGRSRSAVLVLAVAVPALIGGVRVPPATASVVASEAQAEGVARGAGGAEYVAGARFAGVGTHGIATLTRFDGNGARRWMADVPGAGIPESQFGSIGSAVAYSAAGTVFLAGTTNGTAEGSPSAAVGHNDVFVAAFDSHGHRRWTQEFGSTEEEVVWAATTDGAGAVYIAGTTFGTLPGGTSNSGSGEAFVAKLDPAGAIDWIRQNGTPDTDAESIAVNAAGGIDVVGSGGPTLGLLTRYDTDGNMVGSVPFVDVQTLRIAEDASHIYIVGYARGAVDGATGRGSSVVLELTQAGARVAAARFGAPKGSAALLAITISGGHVYVGGYAYGPVKHASGFSGVLDVMIVRFDANLRRQWAVLWGTAQTEDAAAIAPAPGGGVVLAGSSNAPGNWNALTLAVDRHGVAQWSDTYNGS